VCLVFRYISDGHILAIATPAVISRPSNGSGGSQPTTTASASSLSSGRSSNGRVGQSTSGGRPTINGGHTYNPNFGTVHDYALPVYTPRIAPASSSGFRTDYQTPAPPAANAYQLRDEKER
jgi:hypothetical protein